jgi:hypothetical protein
VQFLWGMDDALGAAKPFGTFVWHGWGNGDSYSYWTASSSAKAVVDRVQEY